MCSKLKTFLYSMLFLFYHGSLNAQDLEFKDDIGSISNNPIRYGFIAFFECDYLKNSFSDFKNELDSFNIDLMNKSASTASVELAGYYQRICGGISFGYGNFENDDHDSLNLEFKTRRYSIRTGYNLINSKKFLITPEVAVIWNRYRLNNFNKDRKIDLTQYLTERDLDIKMHQVNMFAGIKLSYKIYRKGMCSSDYSTIGIHGGYNLKLHDKPLIYSRGNRLASESVISVRNFTIGIHFSFNIETMIYG